MDKERYITVKSNEQLKEFLLKYDFDEDIGIELVGSIGGVADILEDGKLDYETLNEIGKNHTIKISEYPVADYAFLTKFFNKIPDAKKFVIFTEYSIENSNTEDMSDRQFETDVLDVYKKRDVTIEGRYELPKDMDERDKKMFSLIKLRGEPIVTLKQYEKYKDLLKDTESFCLYINDASNLPIEDIDKYEFNISSVVLPHACEHLKDRTIYDIDTYKRCRSVIDKMIEDIDVKKLDQATILYEVMERLANHMSYDFSAVDGTEEHKNEVERTSRNMVGGLLENKCVCAGYSEILRNVLACCNIESIGILSKDEYDEEENRNVSHEYNKVKINDKWYYVDLTADRDTLKQDVIPSFFLKSEEEFKQISKKVYHTDRNLYSRNRLDIKCEESYPMSEVYKIVDQKVQKKPIKLLKSKNKNEDEGNFLKRSLIKGDNEIGDSMSVINCIYEVEKNSYIVVWDSMLGQSLLGNRKYSFYKKDDKNNSLIKGESLIKEASAVERKYKIPGKDESENEASEIEMYCVSKAGREYALYEKDGEFSLIEVEQKDAEYCIGNPTGKKLYQENPQNFRNKLKKIYKGAKVTLDKLKKIHDKITPKQRQDEVKKISGFHKRITEILKDNIGDIEQEW